MNLAQRTSCEALPTRTPAVPWRYLLFALVGWLSTAAYNVLAFRELGSAFTPAAFVRAGFEGSPILGSLASDFWVGSAASLIWMVMVMEALFMRERHLATPTAS